MFATKGSPSSTVLAMEMRSWIWDKVYFRDWRFTAGASARGDSLVWRAATSSIMQEVYLAMSRDFSPLTFLFVEEILGGNIPEEGPKTVDIENQTPRNHIDSDGTSTKSVESPPHVMDHSPPGKRPAPGRTSRVRMKT